MRATLTSWLAADSAAWRRADQDCSARPWRLTSGKAAAPDAVRSSTTVKFSESWGTAGPRGSAARCPASVGFPERLPLLILDLRLDHVAVRDLSEALLLLRHLQEARGLLRALLRGRVPPLRGDQRVIVARHRDGEATPGYLDSCLRFRLGGVRARSAVPVSTFGEISCLTTPHARYM